MGEKVSRVFYRYVRPIRFNEKRMELITQPNGGICLRFEEHPSKYLWFTYARCHHEDHFKKDVAKRIADERAENARTNEQIVEAMGMLPNSQNTDLLIQSVIRRCRTWAPTADMDNLLQHYMNMEWMNFADTLEKLYYSNITEERRAEGWKAVVNNMFQETYASQNK